MELSKIDNPSFLKQLTIEELNQLATEIRELLIESISKTGGHLASNLGVVELTIALHKVFNSPVDKLIFDVGHQAYVHKILTGRINKFAELRKYKGLSGFPKISESEHDVYETGHSSTSISAAIGFKFADCGGEVISIIGDGSLTSGVALEALTFAGDLKEKIIIIINDNNFSICKNVGGLSKVLNNLRVNKTYLGIKKGIPKDVKKIGKNIIRPIKYLINNPNYFEALGYKYYGVVDGHDFKDLLKYLEFAKKSTESVIIHVKTEKGKGYEPALLNSPKFHGVSSSDSDNFKTLKISYSEYISECVNNLKIDDLITITAAMSQGLRLEHLKKVIDVGIAESNAGIIAAGIAINKKPVYLPMYSTFSQRAYDSFLHDIAKMNLKVVIGLDRAGIVPGDGDTHQGIFDISMFYPMPNVKITMPKNSSEAKALVEYAFFKNDNPFVIRYPKSDIEIKEEVTVLNGEWIKETSGEINIISYGPDVNRIISICENNSISATIYNAIFIKPYCTKSLDQIIVSNKPLLIYEQVIEHGNLASAVGSYLLENGYSSKVKQMNLKTIPTFGDTVSLLTEHKLDDKSILEEIRKICD